MFAGGIELKNVGLIGVGVMGKLIASRIRDAGHQLYIFDVSKEALSRVSGPNVTVAENPAGIAASTELVLMSLPGPKQVEEAVTGSVGLLTKARPGAIFVDLSTVDPHTTERMAATAAQKGIGYLDAPVLGRPASVGEWSLPVGGDPESLAQCIDILKLFA